MASQIPAQLTFEDFDFKIPTPADSLTHATAEPIEELQVRADTSFVARPLQEIKKDFQKTLADIAHYRHQWEVWQDFVEMASISLRQPFFYKQEAEDRYLEIVSRYKEKDVQLFPALLGLTIESLEGGFNDFLGENFMELGLGNKWVGQFFTPYCVSLMMAQMQGHKTLFQQKNIVRACDPCIGSGCMIIAYCQVLREANINYQNRLYVQGTDISFVAANMSYIQLSLIGCPAHVIWGDSLAVKINDAWATPMHYLNGW